MVDRCFIISDRPRTSFEFFLMDIVIETMNPLRTFSLLYSFLYRSSILRNGTNVYPCWNVNEHTVDIYVGIQFKIFYFINGDIFLIPCTRPDLIASYND